MKWKKETRKLSELKKWAKNPRKMSDEKYRELVESIRQDGDHDILKIDVDNTVISGNRRLDAFKELGMNIIDVKVPPRKLTDEEKDRIAIKSNLHGGEWDENKLVTDFDKELLKSVGLLNSQISGGELREEERELKEYKRVHVLLSMKPEDYIKIKDDLTRILQNDFIEHEKGAN